MSACARRPASGSALGAGPGGAPARRLLLSLVLAGSLAGCADLSQETEVLPAEERQKLPTQEFSDVEMVHTHEGEKRFWLKAPHLYRYDATKSAELFGGIEAEFYEDSSVTSRLTARRGVVEDEGRTLFASGKVVVTTDTGTTILTPRLTWSRDSKMILSDTTVTIITRWDTLHGTGLEATEDLKKRTILEPTGVSFRSVREQEGEPADTALADTALADTAAPPDSAAAGGLPATGGDSLAAPGTSGADTGAVESTPPDSAGQAAHGDGGQGRGEAR